MYPRKLRVWSEVSPPKEICIPGYQCDNIDKYTPPKYRRDSNED